MKAAGAGFRDGDEPAADGAEQIGFAGELVEDVLVLPDEVADEAALGKR